MIASLSPSGLPLAIEALSNGKNEYSFKAALKPCLDTPRTLITVFGNLESTSLMKSSLLSSNS